MAKPTDSQIKKDFAKQLSENIVGKEGNTWNINKGSYRFKRNVCSGVEEECD